MAATKNQEYGDGDNQSDVGGYGVDQAFFAGEFTEHAGQQVDENGECEKDELKSDHVYSVYACEGDEMSMLLAIDISIHDLFRNFHFALPLRDLL
jgi:hypothetical protein